MPLERPRPSINQSKIDVIKQEMNFPRFIQQLPPDKRVIIDWPALLSEIKDTEGTVWRAIDTSYSCDTEHGEMEVHLKSGKDSIGVSIHSLTQGQEDAIDWALWNATNSNAPFVYFKHEPNCFSSFCLVPRKGNVVESIFFVYGNIAVKLTKYGYDVLPLARALHAAMQKAVAANPEGKLPDRPKIIYTVNPPRVNAGEGYTVTAKFDGGAQLDPKGFRVAEELISNNIEYQENLGAGVYKFIAKTAGMGTAAFSLFDKKTLWVFTDSVTVHVDPAK